MFKISYRCCRFPDKAPTSKANAINTGDSQNKAKGKGKQKSQSVPPTPNSGQQKGSSQKKGEKGTGKSGEGKPQSKQASSSSTTPTPSAKPAPAKTGGGNSAVRTENKLPARIRKQCVPWTTPAGYVNGNNCPFKHENDPVTKKPLPPLQEDVERYQAALKRNPSLANPKPASSSGTGKAVNISPTIKMIRVIPQGDSDEEPEPEQEAAQSSEMTEIRPRPPGNHTNPEVSVDLEELSRGLSDPEYTDPVCWHMRNRSMFTNIVSEGNQGASGAVQTLDMMSCVNCSLRHIYRPTVDTRKTCVWTKWLRLISKHRFRMTDPERSQLRKTIHQCQKRRRLGTFTIHQEPMDAPDAHGLEDVQTSSESEHMDDWNQAIREERLSLLARHAIAEGAGDSEATSSGSTQLPMRERVIHVEHASIASHNWITTRQWNSQVAPRGMAFQVYRPTGRTRLISTGEFIPEAEEEPGSDEVEEGQRISAVSVGAVKSITSEDHYCMLDFGANVMVIPWKEGMKGDHTMCALVGDNRTEGLVVARLSTRHRTHLIVAVKEAKLLIPISYLIRIAHYRALWRMMGEHDCFQMKDGYGDPVTVNEEEDLLYVGKTTLWRIGYDLYNSALHTTGRTWPDVWKTLTGEEAPIRSIFGNTGSNNS